MRLVGSLGRDAWGALFRASLGEAGVDLERMRVAEGPTGRCVCLVGPDGQRTMRPCLSDSIRLQAAALEEADFAGRPKWVLLSGYGFYGEEFPERAAAMGRAAGARVALDLASFEVVRR